MNTLMKTAASTLALLLALPACAQQAAPAPADADPALWVVKDDDTTVYLFGTVHVLKPGLTWFDEAVKTAFDRSDTLVLEMIEPDQATQQRVVAAQGMNMSGPPLSEQLPAAKRPAFAQAVADVGLPMAAADRMQPWLAAITLSIAPLTKLGYDPASGAEKVLTAAARGSGKTVAALETFEQQIGFFGRLSPKAQVTFLESTVDELPKLEESMGRMVAQWAGGDADGLARTMNDSLKDSPEVARVLLTDRNRAWAGWIAERMKQPGTVFVAVGAGHLAGNGSVQQQLGGYKLQATRITY